MVGKEGKHRTCTLDTLGAYGDTIYEYNTIRDERTVDHRDAPNITRDERTTNSTYTCRDRLTQKHRKPTDGVSGLTVIIMVGCYHGQSHTMDRTWRTPQETLF